jgi:RimJ/RimL family protein N-acetyltransferase
MDFYPTLVGRHVRLEPLEQRHAQGLAAASAADPSLYRWSPIPQGIEAARKYISTATSWREARTAVPFAIFRLADNQIIGSTRFWEMERWNWPEGHPSHNHEGIDVCEIGWTWFTKSAIRTAANTESKYLMLRHAFEVWQAIRVCLHTDSRNVRSQAAIERLGAKRDGILRAHRMAADFIPRDSVRYSILFEEWPAVKRNLQSKLEQTQ